MKKNIIYSVVLFLSLYFAAHFYTYNQRRSNIISDINSLFMQNAPYWHDSIISINKLPVWGRYSSQTFEKKVKENQDLKVITQDFPDTVKISYSLIGLTDYNLFRQKRNQTVFIISVANDYQEVDLRIPDSLWNRDLRNAGYKDVKASLLVATRHLEDYFPKNDSIAKDAPTIFKSVNHLKGDNIFVTDSVKLGFCDIGYILSYVQLPRSTIMSEAKIIGIEFIIALFGLLIFQIFTFIRIARDKKTEYIAMRMDIMNLGENITYDKISHTLANPQKGEKIKLPRTQAQLLELLIETDNNFATKKEICMAIWKLDEKSATSSYNSIIKRLRDSLDEIGGIYLTTVKDTGIQLIIENKTNRE